MPRRKKKALAEGKKRYRLSGTLTISVCTDVEAASPEEACKILEDEGRPVVTLCHQCSGGNSFVEWVTSGELDGEPEIIDDEEPIEIDA